MKLVYALSIIVLFTGSFAQAASLKEIFQSIADATPTGNGEGHTVTTLKGPFNEAREITKLSKEANYGDNDPTNCAFDVYADINGALSEVKDTWYSAKTAARLSGLHNSGLIKQIIYSAWDQNSGNSEYCTMATMKVYGVDGSLLILEFNQTD